MGIPTDPITLMALRSAVFLHHSYAKTGLFQLLSHNSLKMVRFQGHVEHVLLADNLLLGHFTDGNDCDCHFVSTKVFCCLSEKAHWWMCRQTRPATCEQERRGQNDAPRLDTNYFRSRVSHNIPYDKIHWIYLQCSLTHAGSQHFSTSLKTPWC